MDKQPDKLEVLMDWFLGDAREINETQKKMLEKQTLLLERVDELNKCIDSKIEKSIRDVIIRVRDSCNETKFKIKRRRFIAIILLCVNAN
ncbi:plasmid stabilization protein [Arsenophonus sp. ENCA]|uniref:plasmid stabilization protein StbC n=1 Tax=Arsenophonus sp. ENCA TaxID=1987579 RepID=UPI000BDC7ECE|nr:plasmid stabilization protein StbC [Arsenophonus sp. ENCA]PAV01683.1 plasmid stabilization protein [Arsenophonus sp. ENCA]